MATRYCRPVTLREQTQKAADQFEQVAERKVRDSDVTSTDMILAFAYTSGGLDADAVKGMARLIDIPENLQKRLTELGGTPKAQMSVYDIYLDSLLKSDDLTEAGRRTASEVANIRREYMKSVSAEAVSQMGIPTPTEMNKLAKANLVYLGAIREGIMTSPARVVSAGTMDAMGNAWFQIITGHFDAAKGTLNPRNWLALAKHTMRGGELKHPTLEMYKKLGMEIDSTVIDIATRDLYDLSNETNMAQIFSLGGRFGPGKALSRPFSSKWGRAIRHGIDQNARMFLLGDTFRNEYRLKRIGLFRELRATYGDDAAQEIIDTLGGDRYFTPEQLRQAARGHVEDTDALARRWRKDLSDADTSAINEVNRVHFKMEPTKADEALRHVMLFHFWQSRAALFYPRTVLGNPYLLYNHIKFYEALDKEAERRGFDSPMNMYFKLMQNEGWYLQFDPISYLVPYTMIRDWSVSYQGESSVDKWSRRFGAFVNPAIGAALSVVGASDSFPDLMPNAMRGAITATYNFMVNHGIDPLGTGPGIYGDPILELERRVLNSINDMLADKTNGYVRDVEPFDPKINDQITVNDLIIQQAEEDFGMTYQQMLESDDPKYRDAVTQAKIAVMTGQPNERAERALAEWSTYDQGVNAVVRAVVPGYVPVRSGVTEDRKAASKAGDENARAKTAAVTAGSPEALNLYVERTGYQNVGTENQQALAAGWNQIAYDELNPYDMATIGGKEYFGYEVNAMTPEQRKKLADAWVIEQSYIPTVGNPGTTKTLDEYRDERKQYAAQQTELPGYLDYQKQMGDYNGGEQYADVPGSRRRKLVGGGVRDARTYLEKASPNFARAISDYRGYLQSQGISGDELETRLDSWAMSPDGYNAYRGVKSTLYDPAPKDLSDPSAIPPPLSSGTTESSGGSSGDKKDSTDSEKKDATKMPKWQRELELEVEDYTKAVSDFEAQYGPVSDYMNPGGKIMLTKYIPEPSSDLERYLKWADDEYAAGREPSLDQYFAFRDREYNAYQSSKDRMEARAS